MSKRRKNNYTGDKQSSIKMNGYAILTLLIAGVVSGCKRLEVKRGEKVVLVENKFGLENISRVVALYNASKDCSQKGEISKHCFPKEKESGCTNKNGSTFSFDIGKDSISLTPLNASDGFYVVSIIDVWSNIEKILIVVNGELPHTVIPDPPPLENPEANSTKGTETPGTEDLSTLGFKGGIAVCIAVGFLVWCCLKKKKNNESEASDCKKDPKDNSHIESNIKDEQGDSFKMGDRIPRSEDEDIHSLNEVLIHDSSVGQENERPGQHVQHNNSDDYDDNSKHNNSNNDIDSDFWSNYEDDEI